MSTKQLITASAIIAGTATAAAAHHWPGRAAFYQVLLYTLMVDGLVLIGVWEYRHKRNFFGGLAAILALHGTVLFSMRSLFPFRTVFVVIPFAFVEGIVAFIVMLKVLGDRKSA